MTNDLTAWLKIGKWAFYIGVPVAAVIVLWRWAF